MLTTPLYFLPVGLALLIVLCFPVTKHIQNKDLKKRYYVLQAITMIGAVVGAKISVLIGDYHWPWRPLDDWTSLLTSGRSITGALIGGFVFAETAKPFLRYSLPPNDRFAAVLPFSIAIGRVGCALAGCCRGIPCNTSFAITYSDGIPRFPAQYFEILFHLCTGVVFLVCVKRSILFGNLFSCYLILYGVFRYFSEAARETEKNLLGHSAYQWFSLVMLALGLSFLLKRMWWPPASWDRVNAKV